MNRRLSRTALQTLRSPQQGRVRWWVLLAVVTGLLAAWFAWWFFSSYERVTETRRLPASGEAVSNPYYAAELFLREQGLEVQSVGSNTPLVRLPAADDVLLVRNMGASVTEHRVDALLDWVEQGGTLIVESHDVLSAPDADSALQMCKAHGCDDEEWEQAREEARADAEENGEAIEHPLLARLGIYLTYPDRDTDTDTDADADAAGAAESVWEELRELERLEKQGQQQADSRKIDNHRGRSREERREKTGGADDRDDREGSVDGDSSDSSHDTADAGAEGDALVQRRSAQREISGEDEYEVAAPAAVALSGGGEALVAVNTSVTLVDSEGRAAQQWQHDGAVYMLRVDRGNGSIWVLNDTDFMQSRTHRSRLLRELLPVHSYEIERHDHAYFLYRLVMGGIKNSVESGARNSADSIGAESMGKVWLLYSADARPLYLLLWDKARWAIKGFALLLLVWLWWMHNRFGPPLGKLDAPRRNLLEHLRMSGSFAWQQDEGKRLWQRNRDQLLADIVRKQPRLSRMDTAAQAQTLSEITGYPASTIHSALFTEWKGERDFVYLTDMLRRIRKKL